MLDAGPRRNPGHQTSEGTARATEELVLRGKRGPVTLECKYWQLKYLMYVYIGVLS